jgi:hypothetical protein
MKEPASAEFVTGVVPLRGLALQTALTVLIVEDHTQNLKPNTQNPTPKT